MTLNIHKGGGWERGRKGRRRKGRETREKIKGWKGRNKEEREGDKRDSWEGKWKGNSRVGGGRILMLQVTC